MNSHMVLLDAFFTIASFVALLIIIFLKRKKIQTDIRILVSSLLLLNIVYGLCLLFEWTGGTNILEPYEDLTGALIPMMWAFIFYAIMSNISEQQLKKYQDHLENLVEERTKKLRIANRELGDFAYIVSHDLKAPLRAIGQLSQWIAEDNAKNLDEDGKKNLEMLKARVKRMYRLIDDILAYSRAGRDHERKEEIDMMRLTEEVIDSLYKPSNIRIEIENQLPVIVGSRVHFQQIIQNLLSNSIKFMDKPEGIISVGCKREGSLWRFWVRDNGPGIEAKYKEKIFHIFQVLSPSRDQDSTGIGLTLVKKIVELYGGEIDMESEVGKYCEFIFTLPAQTTGEIK